MSDPESYGFTTDPEAAGIALPETTLKQLSPRLQEACARMGWDQLMPVQSKTIPYQLAGHDLMVQARTGSGKTGAFVLPIIERIHLQEPNGQALALVPTRELAKQVAADARSLGGEELRVTEVYGGVSYNPQVEAFRQGAHLVVGTPGRVLDHLMRGNLKLTHIRTLIFDEADRMLSIGFYQDMRNVQRYLPRRPVQTLMFSATYPPLVMQLSEQFLTRPILLSLSSDQVYVAGVSHQFYEVPAMGKERSLMRIIEVENPDSAIIFCNTKAQVEFLTAVLKQFGYDADMLTSDLSQNKREEVLSRCRAGTLRFLVATDVAARGIDIHGLSHVFLMEPPEDKESYIHRAGRTGRAGASGAVITLADLVQKMELRRIAVQYKIDLVQRDLPTEADVSEAVTQRAVNVLENRLRHRDALRRERMERFLPLAGELAADENGRHILAMLLDDFYQAAVHAPCAPETARREPMRRPRVGAARRSAGESRGPGHKPAAAGQSGVPAAQGESAPAKKRRRRPRKRKPAGGNGAASNGQNSETSGSQGS